MTVDVENSIATVTMTIEELGIIRYTLFQGYQDLRSAANYHNSMKDICATSSKDTADRAEEATKALEEATQEWVRRPRVNK